MYDSKYYNCLKKIRIRCKECNREFDISATDLKRENSVNLQYIYECPKCCSRNSIMYDNLPVTIRDSI